MTVPVYPKRGFIYFIRLDYVDRPADREEKHMVIVVQSNKLLRHTTEVNVLEVTSNIKNASAPFNVFLSANTLPCSRQFKDSKVKCHFLYGVKIEDLLSGEYCGQVPDEVMAQIDDALLFSLGFLNSPALK